MAAFAPFEPQPRIAVAYSGGPDSLSLLALSQRWAAAQGGAAHAFIVDHGLRAESADEARRAAAMAAEGASAILFGAERSGLDNDEVARAHVVVEAPLNPGFTSLNLAQAVLLVAWEWRMAAGLTAGAPGEDQPRATAAERDGLFGHLTAELRTRGFFKSPEKGPRVLRNLRALIARADPSAQEVRTLRGIVKCLTDRPPR